MSEVRRGLVYGIGVNDADYITQPSSGSSRSICPFYRTWAGMLRRCYSKTALARNPTYTGCTVHPDWLKFMAFRKWMERQDWKGKHLDKDLLLQGSRIYSESTCVFISQQLNKFMTGSATERGQFKVGVELNAESGKFVARCCNPIAKRRENLGYFAEEDAAHAAWVKRKTEIAKDLADLQSDERLKTALRGGR